MHIITFAFVYEYTNRLKSKHSPLRSDILDFFCFLNNDDFCIREIYLKCLCPFCVNWSRSPLLPSWWFCRFLFLNYCYPKYDAAIQFYLRLWGKQFCFSKVVEWFCVVLINWCFHYSNQDHGNFPAQKLHKLWRPYLRQTQTTFPIIWTRMKAGNSIMRNSNS